MDVGIVVIQDDGIVAIDFGPAFDAGYNGRLAGNGGNFFDTTGKFGADEAFVDKFIARLEPALCIPLCHSCRGACSAWGAVNGLISVEHGIAGSTARVEGFSCPKDMGKTSNSLVLEVYKVVAFVHFLSKISSHGDELLCFEVLNSREVFLRINNAVEVASIGYIHVEGT